MKYKGILLVLFVFGLFAETVYCEPSDSSTLYKPVIKPPVASTTNVSNVVENNSGNDYLNGKIDGERDAETASVGAWIFAGCCLGEMGILGAYVIDPIIPTNNLAGKPSVYMIAYTASYKQKIKSRRGKQAMIGCAGLMTGYIILYAILLSNAPQPYSTY